MKVNDTTAGPTHAVLQLEYAVYVLYVLCAVDGDVSYVYIADHWSSVKQGTCRQMSWTKLSWPSQ